jgi:hypothetical protein
MAIFNGAITNQKYSAISKFTKEMIIDTVKTRDGYKIYHDAFYIKLMQIFIY